PVDRIAALAVANAEHALMIEIPADADLDRPAVFTLTGTDGAEQVFGHLVIKVGAFARGTLVLEHRGSATYASSVTIIVGDGANIEFVRLELWDDDAVHAG